MLYRVSLAQPAPYRANVTALIGTVLAIFVAMVQVYLTLLSFKVDCKACEGCRFRIWVLIAEHDYSRDYGTNLICYTDRVRSVSLS